MLLHKDNFHHHLSLQLALNEGQAVHALCVACVYLVEDEVVAQQLNQHLGCHEMCDFLVSLQELRIMRA